MRLGIDIVDLQDPSFKERKERSLKLIQHEDDQIIDHPMQFWLLWSAKEAVFKYNREPINFSPTKIPISLSSDGHTVQFKSKELTGFFTIEENHIVAICGDANQIDFEIFENPDGAWTESIRMKVIDFFRDLGKDYHIGSDELNLPTIEPGHHHISISHHGRFGAVAFPKSLR